MEYIIYLCTIKPNMMEKETVRINRIKVVLAEKGTTNTKLAEMMSTTPQGVSKLVTNRVQPNLETLVQIAKCLEVDVKDLLYSTK